MEPLKIAPTIKAIWIIDEYAISTLVSTISKQTIGKINKHHKETDKTKKFVLAVLMNLLQIFNNPNPPSFKRTPAKIIEPTTGAST